MFPFVFLAAAVSRVYDAALVFPFVVFLAAAFGCLDALIHFESTFTSEDSNTS